MQIFLLLGLGFSAHADFNLNPSLKDFRKVCAQHRLERAPLPEAPEVGVETYFPTTALEASQTRFSFLRFLTAMKKAMKEESNGFYHDHKRSLYGMNKRIKAVHYRGRLYVVDGHHRALISTYLGAQTIPVQVMADLSYLSFEKFRSRMEDKGWGLWRGRRNSPMAHRDLCEMVDDPNFQLARMIIRRVTVELTENGLRVTRSTGAHSPVAVKVNGDVAFFEIYLADAITAAGYVYDGNRKITKKDKRFFLEVLKSAAERQSSPLSKVLLLDEVKPVAKLEFEQLVYDHLTQRSCDGALK